MVLGRARKLEGILPEVERREAPLPKRIPGNRKEIFALETKDFLHRCCFTDTSK